MNKALAAKIRALPTSPGVYIFKNEKGLTIYVGKANNLKMRVNSYLQSGLEAKTSQMISQASDLDYLAVETEIEALLLEAELVSIKRPKYNIQLKDDKTPIYIGIVKEEYPRVVLIRRTQLKNFRLRKVFGPFTSAQTARRILKRIRKVFPYSTHRLGKRACIYSQIGLCNPCPNSITTTEEKQKYLKNITKISETLSGKITQVRKDLGKQMKDLSLSQNYEEAEKTLKRVKEMDIFTHSFDRTEDYLTNPNLLTDIRQSELKDLKKILINCKLKIKNLRSIECYDAAHLMGTYPTASRVTFVDGEPDKSLYRHYKIPKKLRGDTDRLKEVFERRLKADKLPDLIIVDGGKPQVSAASSVFGNNFPLVGLAKRHETLVFLKDGLFSEVRLKDSAAKRLVQRIRDEAHRFARAYHHKLVAKALTNS